MAWATKDQARAHIADFRPLDDAVLDTLLEVATEQCAGYAQVLEQPHPARFMLGCVYQAKEILAASERGSSDVIGVGDFVIRARPLTAAVKALLRPELGRPGLG